MFDFVKLTFFQLFFAICIVASLQIFELLLVNKLISFWPLPDQQIYSSWLAAIAQIGGVFIALYFTAVTATAASAYSQVPNNVRDLLARERVGNIYIRYLILATFIPLCFIGLQLLGFEPLRLAVPLLVLVAGIGIIAFAKLGQRAFYLFDPTRLSVPLFWELHKWIDQVSAGGFRWLDSAFQNHAHRLAGSVLDTTETLSDISSSNQSLNNRPLLDLTIQILHFLARYQRNKLMIPTTSLWFEQQYKYKDWYLTPDSTVQLAHQTGTTLFPETVTDQVWIEKRLEPLINKCFEINIEAGRLDNLVELLGAFATYAKSLAATQNTSHAVSLIDSLFATFERKQLSSEASKKAVEGNPRKVLSELDVSAIVDRLSVLQIEVLLAYAEALELRDPTKANEMVAAIDWNTLKSVYRTGFTHKELVQLEWLFPRLQFEAQIEGHVVTQSWYIHALISKAQADGLAENIASLLKCGTLFERWSKSLDQTGHPWACAAVLSREIEYISRLESRHLGLWEEYLKSLEAKRYLKDLQWPDLKPEDWSAQTQKLRQTLTESLAAHIGPLFVAEKPEGTMDFLGQFIHTVGESIFDALLNNKVNEVKALVGPYFAGNFLLFDKLKPAGSKLDTWSEQRLFVAAAPMLDLIELSGYAILLSAFYHNDALWTAVREIWDRFLKEQAQAIKWISAVAIAGEPPLQLPHRGLIRTNWRTRVERLLDKLERRRIVIGRGPMGNHYDDQVIHDSPLVRHCAQNHFDTGKDIFVALYLSKQPGAETISWGNRVQDFEQSLEREKEQYNDNGTEEPPE